MNPSVQSRRRVAVALSTLVAVAVVLGAWRSSHPRHEPPVRGFALGPEAEHREHVLDSVASTIDTDSLYHMYRSILNGADPVAVHQQVACMGDRIYSRYGALAADRALRRMFDTLWKGVEVQQREIWARVPSHAVGISDSICGPSGPRGPLVVDGVELEPGALKEAQAPRAPR